MHVATPPLVEQPTIQPTRKWKAAAIAETVVVILGISAKLGFDLEISEEDVTQVFTAFGILVAAAGRIASWVTKNRAPAVPLPIPPQPAG